MGVIKNVAGWRLKTTKTTRKKTSKKDSIGIPRVGDDQERQQHVDHHVDVEEETEPGVAVDIKAKGPLHGSRRWS